MPRPGLTLAAVLVAASPAAAQAPPAAPGGGAHLPVPGAGQPAAAPPVDPAVLAHLQAWEKVMADATNFRCPDGTLVRADLLLKKTATYAVDISCLKPNLAAMSIKRKPDPGQPADPTDMVGYICTGREVFEYDGKKKEVTEYKLQNNGVGDNLLLEFISGSLKAADVVRRFDLRKVQDDDQHYVYLELRPRLPRDKQEFEAMILVLFRPTVPGLAYLPRTVVIRKGNNQAEERWDFGTKTQTNVPGMNPQAFAFVKPPADWKVLPAQPAQGPGPRPQARPAGQ